MWRLRQYGEITLFCHLSFDREIRPFYKPVCFVFLVENAQQTILEINY